jgi:DNA-binding NarL/FixJ family response regulator
MTDQCTTTSRPTTTSILICDERTAARRELAIALTAGGAVCRVAENGADLIEEFGFSPAGVVMIGVHHGSNTGTAAMRMLLDRHPTAHVIAYGAVQDCAILARALAHGARGLMIWDIGQRLNHRPVLGGGHPYGPGNGSGRRPSAPSLTEREIQILKGMSNGRPNSEIGRELYISEDTVKTHARRLFNKIGALDRAHAVALGLRGGLL